MGIGTGVKVKRNTNQYDCRGDSDKVSCTGAN